MNQRSPRDEEAEIQRLSLLYAYGIDSRNLAFAKDVFVEDGLLRGYGINAHGTEAIADASAGACARMFAMTMHQVHNALVTVQGESATGVIYCVAHHINEAAGGVWTDLVVTIVYNDQYVKRDAIWRIKERHIDVRWNEIRQIRKQGPH